MLRKLYRNETQRFLKMILTCFFYEYQLHAASSRTCSCSTWRIPENHLLQWLVCTLTEFYNVHDALAEWFRPTQTTKDRASYLADAFVRCSRSHIERFLTFHLHLQSWGRSEMDPGETICSKDQGRRAPAGARIHEPRARRTKSSAEQFRFAESDVELALSSSPSSWRPAYPGTPGDLQVTVSAMGSGKAKLLKLIFLVSITVRGTTEQERKRRRQLRFEKHLRDDPVAFSRVHFYCRFFCQKWENLIAP